MWRSCDERIFIQFAESEMERGLWAKIRAMAELSWASKIHTITRGTHAEISPFCFIRRQYRGATMGWTTPGLAQPQRINTTQHVLQEEAAEWSNAVLNQGQFPSLSPFTQIGDRNVFSTNSGLFSRDFAWSHHKCVKHGNTQHLPWVKHFRSSGARIVHLISPHYSSQQPFPSPQYGYGSRRARMEAHAHHAPPARPEAAEGEPCKTMLLVEPQLLWVWEEKQLCLKATSDHTN